MTLARLIDILKLKAKKVPLLALLVHDLTLIPGTVATLALGWALDRQFGEQRGFLWTNPAS
jgi:hypothetical protein